MPDEKQPEPEVTFRVTRPRTRVYHPDRAVRRTPALTGETISLPKSEAEYHVRQHVGEIVDLAKEAAEKEAASKAAKEAAAKAAKEAIEETQETAKRGPGRPRNA